MISWQLTPYIAPLLFAAFLAVLLARSAWRRRSVPGSMAFAWLMLAAGIWSLVYAFELGSTDLAAKIYFAKIQYFGVVGIPAAWLVFALRYAGRGERLVRHRRYAALLAFMPLVTLILIWTNESHHLFWKDVRLIFSPFVIAVFEGGIWYWINNVAYTYMMLLLGIVILLQKSPGLPRFYFKQVFVLLLVILIPWLANALYMFGLTPFSYIDFTPFAFVLAGLAISWGYLRFQLLDFGPLARDMVIESMPDGVLILDSQGRITDINPAACHIFGRPAQELIGRIAEQTLPHWPDLATWRSTRTDRYEEFVAPMWMAAQPGGAAAEPAPPLQARYYDLHISPLYDWFKRLTSHIILIIDVTDREQADKTQREAHFELEQQVARRTHELVQVNTALQLEIAERKRAEQQAKRYGEQLLAVNRLTVELSAAPPQTDIYPLIAGTLKTITDAMAIAIAAYDSASKELVLKHLAVEKRLIGKVNRILGWNILGIRTPVSQELWQRMASEVVTTTDNLAVVTSGVIPSPVSALIKRIMKIESFSGLAFNYAGELMGTAVIVMPSGRPAPDADLMRIFSYAVATALRRKQVEDALRRSEEQYRLLFESVHDVIYSIDPEFRVLSVSPAVERALGYKPEELIGKSFLELNILPPDQMGLALADAERVFRGERVTSSEYQFIAKDGTRKVGEVTGVPLILDGEIKAVISVARDISTRKRAIEATIRSSRLEATATLAGGIAHDVNNLMVGVLGYADFLKMELGRRKQPVAYPNAIAMLDCIIRSAERTSELTHQLLAYARGGKYNPKVINLNDTLHEMVQVRTSAMPAAINVEMNLEPNLWRVEADPTQMSQVTTNLFTNAVEAIEGCGQIRITTHNLIAGNPTCPTPPDLKAGPYVCVTIEDTGSGIKEQNLPRIFEPFFTTKFQGRGMGLAATYGIVDNHGGCIAVRSEEGKGAIFEVYLPARQSELIQ